MVRRATGALLVLLGTVGIVLSGLAVAFVWRAARDVRLAADATLLLASDTLNNLDRSLEVTSRTLDQATIAMDGLYTTTIDINEALSSTQVTLDEMARLAGDDLPDSVEASLIALEAVEETAAVIDELLRGFQQLGIGDYDPVIPLDEAVAEAGAGLEPVPDSLRAMASGLEETRSNLEGVQAGIDRMGYQMLGIRENAGDAGTVVASQLRTMQKLQKRVRSARHNLERPIRTVAGGVTLLLIWIGLSQLAIVRWGIGLWMDARQDDSLNRRKEDQ